MYKLAKWDDYPWLCPPQKRSLFFQLFDDDGSLLPHYVLRQEMLGEGLAQLMQAFAGHQGENPAGMPPVNKSKPGGGQYADYQQYYDAEMKEIIEQRFRDDLRAFVYNFDGHDGRALFRPQEACFDHAAGRYTRVPEATLDCTSATVPEGRLADLDMHQWGHEILSHFSGGQLMSELFTRLCTRVAG